MSSYKHDVHRMSSPVTRSSSSVGASSFDHTLGTRPRPCGRLVGVTSMTRAFWPFLPAPGAEECVVVFMWERREEKRLGEMRRRGEKEEREGIEQRKEYLFAIQIPLDKIIEIRPQHTHSPCYIVDVRGCEKTEGTMTSSTRRSNRSCASKSAFPWLCGCIDVMTTVLMCV